MDEARGLRIRNDIQQLRGIAVIVVVLNHLDIPGFSRGFLGVDVFFVVSGFVITSSLLTPASGYPSRWRFFTHFWMRRIFRLWPMLFATVSVTSILIVAGGLALPSTLLTGAASLVGVSNFRLLVGRLDYFALNTTNDWFMHTWSLAVEEQVYFLLSATFALAYSRRNDNAASLRRPVLIVIIASLCASSVAAAFISGPNELVRFYAPHTRFFQIGFGSLLALVIVDSRNAISKLSSRLPQAIHFVLLLSLLYQFSTGPTSPVVSSLSITLATVALLALASREQHASGVVPARWLITIGDRSYSIYLVHWPIQLLWDTFTSNRWQLIAGSVATTLVIAFFSYRFVENPTRRMWVRLNVRKALILPVTGLILALGVSLGSFAFLDREARSEHNQAHWSTCDDNAARVWVIGDSHLYATPVESIVSDHIAGKCGSLGGYGLVLNFDDLGWNADGGRRLRALLPSTDFVEKQILLREVPPEAVIITHFLTGYLADQSTSPASASLSFVVSEWQDPSGRMISREEFLRLFAGNLSRIADTLDGFGASLIVTSPPPDFDWYSGSKSNNFCRDRFIVSRECSILGTEATISVAQHEARGAEIRQLLDDLERSHRNFVHLRLDSPFCTSSSCSNHAGGKALYMDDDHINDEGGRLVKPLIDRTLNQVLPNGPTEITCPSGSSVFACRVIVRGGLTDRYSRPATFPSATTAPIVSRLTHVDNDGNSYCLSLTPSDEITFTTGVCGP